MQTTIAVTGASGHIGNVVCRMLAEKGYPVKAMYHSDKRPLDDLPVSLVQGDVLNKQDVAGLLEGCEVVIHCAAIISINGDRSGRVFQTNTIGPANIVEAARRAGVRKIIHISSTHAVMETPSTGVFDETRPYKTEGAYRYDYSKACGEQIILAAKSELEVTVLRPSSVIGPFDFKPSEMGKALLDFYRSKIPFLPAGGYNFVDVRDVAGSIISAIESARNGEVYLLSGRYYSMPELAALIGQVTDKKMPRIVLPYRVLESALPLVKWYSKITGSEPLFTNESIDALKNGHPAMDNSKAMKELGHNPRPLGETIRDFYKWQLENKRLKRS